MVRELIRFIDSSPTPFHAVSSVIELCGDGFERLNEAEPFVLKPASRYLVTRNDSSLIAFITPEQFSAQSRAVIVGAHTDSPTLKLKPVPVFEKEGYLQLGVEVYGGPLLASWTDRDLGIAGRLLYRGADAFEPDAVLYRSARSLCRIPQLAIHLNREVNKKGLLLNAQTEMAPIWGLASEGQTADALMEHISLELGRDAADVLSFDLVLFDMQPSSLSGIANEFVHAPRLDNLAMCFAATRALVGAKPHRDNLRVIALFDNEEVGSQSHRGAGGNFLEQVLSRTMPALGVGHEQACQIYSRSLFVSADMAHAVHPNYSDKHEPRHMPQLNQGPVIKTNAQERYATTGFSASVLRHLCERLEIPHQLFVNRTDLACGSTIGPMTAARLGMPTVDVGNPMLSMHSVRELAGASDVAYADRLLAGLFE